MTGVDVSVESNPFCSRNIRPGAVPFLFPPGENCEVVTARLQANDWWGQIIGNHGTGKSALLAALTPAIETLGCRTLLVELHDGQRCLPRDVWRSLRRLKRGLVIVDGFEQLSRWSRFWLQRSCRLRRLGLLVTSHVSVGLPTIYRTAISAASAEQIVRVFLDGREPQFSLAELHQLIERHQGDFRETLFSLYDLCEQRRAAAVSKTEPAPLDPAS